MGSLSFKNTESELSYAYIHAVAAHAGMGCKVTDRHDDNNGVDAHITAWGPFANGGILDEVDLKIQLKATVIAPADTDKGLSYFLKDVEHYNDLRAPTRSIPRFLVVLFLPAEHDQWLTHSAEQLVLRNCAYWVSLRSASSVTTAGTTVYLPKNQAFTPGGLHHLAAQLSRLDFPFYHLP